MDSIRSLYTRFFGDAPAEAQGSYEQVKLAVADEMQAFDPGVAVKPATLDAFKAVKAKGPAAQLELLPYFLIDKWKGVDDALFPKPYRWEDIRDQWVLLLLKSKKGMTSGLLAKVLRLYMECSEGWSLTIYWPLAQTVTVVERWVKKNGLSADLRVELDALRGHGLFAYNRKDVIKIKTKLDILLLSDPPEEEEVAVEADAPVSEDPFAILIQYLETTPEAIPPADIQLFQSFKTDLLGEVKSQFSHLNPKLSTVSSYKALRKKKAEVQIGFIRFLLVEKWLMHTNPAYALQPGWGRLIPELFKNLFRVSLDYTVADWVGILGFMAKELALPRKNAFKWPVLESVKGLEKYVKKTEMTTALRSAVAEFAELELFTFNKDYLGRAKWILDAVLAFPVADATLSPPVFEGEDAFSQRIHKDLNALSPVAGNQLLRLLHLAASVSGGKPAKKFIEQAAACMEQCGKTVFQETIEGWLGFAASLKNKRIEYDSGYWYEEYLADHLPTRLKGMVWTCTLFFEESTLSLLAALAERTYRKIPGHGPAAAAVGNACFYVLGQSDGFEGIAHLSQLKYRIRQPQARKLIDKYIVKMAEARGLSLGEMEDLVVQDFGLEEGQLEWNFGEYQAILRLERIGKAQVQWINPKGKVQKSVPAVAKNDFPEELKALRSTHKEIQKHLTAQRDRLDRSYVEDRVWTYESFAERLLNHGLLSFIVRKLIWEIKTDGQSTAAFYLNGTWVDVNEKPLPQPDTATQVRLWHPALHPINEVVAWREFMLNRSVRQPFKQAFREVYLLTDAERGTATYSNRMAAHVLKQHQFNSLANIRKWKYTLLGAYDHGMNGSYAEITLPAHQLKVQFWTNEILDDNDQFNEAGIWLYVSTDQVRFLKENEPINLEEVPVIVFSEMMRDVDLFVGVASVGNDPEWQDSGGVAGQTYWRSYSFGDLTELAKTRKAVLENLLPRLKIAKVAHIQGPFLVVKGTQRTYKIHIGSTNILMEPNDQYLCIVPDRKKGEEQQVFLPFEGDRGFSILLSKAFLLAADDKITDSTILSQLRME